MARYIINLSAFLLMFGVGMIVALLPQRIIHLSGTVSSVGYLASAFALAFVLVQIPIGKLSDCFGFKSFLASGYFICAGTGLLYYFSDSANLIFLGRMFQGIGEVPIWALAPALLAIQNPDQKGKFMGLYNASLHCGLTAGSLSGIWVANIWQGNEAFLLFAGMSFIGGFLVIFFVKDPEQKSNAVATESAIKRTVGKGELLSLVGKLENSVVFAGILLYGAGYGIFVTMIPGFLISVKQSDQTSVSIFFVLFYIAVSLSQLVAGPFSDYKGRKPAMIIGLAMACVGMALFSGFSHAWLFGFLTLAAFGLGTYCVSALAFLNESVSDALKGTISGTFYFFWGIGYFTGPLLLGVVVKGALGQPAAWHTGFKILAGLFVMELIASIVLLNRPAGTKIPEEVVDL